MNTAIKTDPAFRYYMHDGTAAFSFELSGMLTGRAATELETAWRTASSVIGRRRLVVDSTYLTGADDAGRELLRRWHTGGAQFVAQSAPARSLLESIIGGDTQPFARRANQSTWLPYRIAGLLAITSGMLVVAKPAGAASLRPEAVVAWDEYVKAAICTNRDRLVSGKPFLRSEETPGQTAKLRAGTVIVSPAGPHVPLAVPDGLIHDWIGAAFVPRATIADVLAVVRDYDRYKDYYHPSVVASKVIAGGGAQDSFSMVLMNQSALSKVALDSDYKASYTRMDQHRLYSVSEATRIQEIADFGSPSQHMRAENEGSGLIWRMLSFTRFEERDGGVYIELEAIALSRDIPSSLRWLIAPIVRRISAASITATLRETQAAVRAALVDLPRGANDPSISTTVLRAGLPTGR